MIGRSWPTWRPHSQIDHILVQGAVRAVAGRGLPALGIRPPADSGGAGDRIGIGGALAAADGFDDVSFGRRDRSHPMSDTAHRTGADSLGDSGGGLEQMRVVAAMSDRGAPVWSRRCLPRMKAAQGEIVAAWAKSTGAGLSRRGGDLGRGLGGCSVSGSRWRGHGPWPMWARWPGTSRTWWVRSRAGRDLLRQAARGGRRGDPRDRPGARATRPRSARSRELAELARIGGRAWPEPAPPRLRRLDLRARRALPALQRRAPHH